MNKQALIFLCLIVVLISCSKSDRTNEKPKEALIKKDTTPVAVQVPKNTAELNRVDQDKQGDREPLDLSYEFKDAKIIDLKDSIVEDLNGDGTADNAIFTTENGKSGILITDGKTKQETRIGLGHSFEERGDDFSWVDYWGIVKDSTTYEIIIENAEILGDTTVYLENPSILIRKEEVGGGLITFRNGKYEWIHQAD
uniref:Lipoprotein n=1 Tax=Roseihalotalea indica TaxID=2867963 RepID=A0AA49GTL1_9BACT|nr:hypothetical protein K4G66_01635 [Tunicatimonas sp. TK19036]